jgi:hypothetical protein
MNRTSIFPSQPVGVGTADDNPCGQKNGSQSEKWRRFRVRSTSFTLVTPA